MFPSCHVLVGCSLSSLYHLLTTIEPSCTLLYYIAVSVHVQSRAIHTYSLLSSTSNSRADASSSTVATPSSAVKPSLSVVKAALDGVGTPLCVVGGAKTPSAALTPDIAAAALELTAEDAVKRLSFR